MGSIYDYDGNEINIGSKGLPSAAVVAASDSTDSDKSIADYVCDGINDEVTIQQALDSSNGTVYLAVGNYYIDSFPNSDGAGNYVAIMFKNTKQECIKICGLGYGSSRKYSTTDQLYGGAILNIRTTTYNNLTANQQYMIFSAATSSGSRIYPFFKVSIDSVSFMIPDNQKKIICIDGWYMSNLSISNILAIAKNPSDRVQVDGLIGVRGLQGSNFGTGNIWRSCFVWGFYEGYAVSGEHVIGMDLGARYCNYGFTFNRKPNGVGAWSHPITMINCCDECNYNMPVFGNNGEQGKTDNKSGRQTINLIDYNLEWLSTYYAKGGNYATELYPGFTFGDISFTVQTSFGGNSKNSVSTKFWADGSGQNVKTINKAHQIAGTSAERATYTPQYMQQYFDTTLNKMLIYDGSAWKDMNGTSV